MSDDDGGTSVASTATVTFTNADPVADAGPGYDGDEGEVIQLDGTVSDVGENDVLTWSWAYAPGANVDPGATCDFSDENALDPTISCTDDGEVTLTLKVEDDDGGEDTDTAILTLSNVAPVANAGGPYTGAVEGTAINLTGSATDQGANDSHTFKWTVDDTGIDGGGSCSITDDTDPTTTITCNDNGTLKLSLVAKDDDGLSSVASQVTIAVANVNPVANAGSYTGGVEGTAFNLDGSATDQGTNDTHTFKWTLDNSGIDGGGSCSIDDDTAADAEVTCNDNGTLKVILVATDDDGGVSLASQATISIANADPEITAFTKSDGTDLPSTLIVAGTLGLKVAFDDDGTNDTHTLAVDCGSGTFAAPPRPVAGDELVQLPHHRSGNDPDQGGGRRRRLPRPQPLVDGEVRLRRVLRPGRPAHYDERLEGRSGDPAEVDAAERARSAGDGSGDGDDQGGGHNLPAWGHR